MSLTRTNKIGYSNDTDIIFHVISWYAEDIDVREIHGEKKENVEQQPIYEYMIKCFGVNIKGQSVALTITHFRPYFYIKVDDNWTSQNAARLKHILQDLYYLQEQKDDILATELVEKKDFWGFTNFKPFKFIKLTFRSLKTMKSTIYKINNGISTDGTRKLYYYPIYETNIDPFIRLIHENNIEPGGWIKVPKNLYRKNIDILSSSTQIDICTKAENVKRYETLESAPFLIASFDIECMSNTGDFPVAAKDYKKLATQLYELYYTGIPKETSRHKKTRLIEKACFYAIGFSNEDDQDEEVDITKYRYKDYIHPLEFKDKNISKPRLKKYFQENIMSIINILDAKTDKLNKKKKDPEYEKKSHVYITHELHNFLQELNLPKLCGDPIIQIGTTFHIYGEKECSYRHIVTLGSCTSFEGTEVESCETEDELLLIWRNMINRKDPDVIIGYNILGFDFTYLYYRARDLGISDEFLKLGRLTEYICPYKEQSLSSSALGDNLLRYIDMPGRVIIDLMKIIQRDHKLDSFKLDNVAYHFLQLRKNDVGPQDIFRLQKGTAKDRSVIAEYCIKDCELCNKLLMKLEILANNMGMANVCLVPLSFILMRGQGIKVFSLVMKQCSDDGYIIPVRKMNTNANLEKDYDDNTEKEQEQESYEGAIVLEPKEGIYIDDPVSVMDYSSLYPSSMISENLSHDCMVIDQKYNDLSTVEYNDIEYDKYVGKLTEKRCVGKEKSRFVQLPNNEKGIMPRILSKLLTARKATRKKIENKKITIVDKNDPHDKKIFCGIYDEEKGQLKTANDIIDISRGKEENKEIIIEDEFNDFQKKVLDGLQNAFKVTANSLYGQMGAKTSPLYLKDIAACTTATGRNMILKAKEFLEKHYQANIIYGDSVTSYTPVLIKDNMGNINLHTIDTLAERYGNSKWLSCHENGRQTKEACELYGIETWTDNGWTALHRVIRHTLAPHKKIVRVLTHTGLVDVTDDHSLLDSEGHPVTSKDVSIGTPLLHHAPPVCGHNDETFSEAEAQVMGFFFGDGSCGNYSCKSGKKVSWALNNANDGILKRYLSLCEKTYPEFKWVVMSTKKSSGVDKISLRCEKKYGLISKFVEKYRSIMYDGNDKIIPCQILNSPIHIKEAFWRGLYDADGDKDKNGYIRIDQKSMLSASHIALLASYLGKDVSINTRVDKPNIFRLTITTRSQRKKKSTIKKMYEVPYTGHVYDLTTDNHHFAAGVGRLILHNTDSVFAIFPNKDEHGNKITGHAAIKKSIETASEASEKFKKYLKKPHDLEYEKTFWPFIILSKKRYVGNLYGMDDQHYKQNNMGIVLKRRDNAPIVKTIYGGIVNRILNDQDIRGSIRFLQESLDNLVQGKYPLEELIITKSLRANYKNPASIAHKVLSDRMAERDPGDKPQVNDRIPYAYVCVPENMGKKYLQGERIENPKYIIDNNLKIDYYIYLRNQIMNPVCQLLSIVIEQISDNTRNYKLLWRELYEKEKQEKQEKGENIDEKKVKEKWLLQREKDTQDILFGPYLKKLEGEKKVAPNPITNYFPKKPSIPNTHPTQRPSTRLSPMNSAGSTISLDSTTSSISIRTGSESAEKKKSKSKPQHSIQDLISFTENIEKKENEKIEKSEKKNQPSQVDKIRELRTQKKSLQKIAEELGTTVYRVKQALA